MRAMGVDIGGSGIKGAPVSLETGALETNRFRVPTPNPATPESVSKTAAYVVDQFDFDGPVGYGFPAVVTSGIVRTAANIDPSWIGVNAIELLEQATGRAAVFLMTPMQPV